MRRWRKMTWVLVIWTALMAAWIIAGAATADNASKCANSTALSTSTCTSARNAGTGIGIALLIVLWFIGFVVLGLVWLMSRPRRRLCPACGHDVKRGLTACSSCGHSFVPVAGAAAA